MANYYLLTTIRNFGQNFHQNLRFSNRRVSEAEIPDAYKALINQERLHQQEVMIDNPGIEILVTKGILR